MPRSNVATTSELQVLSVSLEPSRCVGTAEPSLRRTRSVAIDPVRAREIARRLHAHGMPAMVLATCHRLEVYWWGHRAQRDVALEIMTHVAETDAAIAATHHEDNAAFMHLMAVASGVRSPRQGEPEILGQVRTAWRKAYTEGWTNDDFDHAVQGAISAARYIRRTNGSWSSDSIGDATVSLITRELTHLHVDGGAQHVLVVGAGAVGVSVAQALHAQRMGKVDTHGALVAHAPWTLEITNRTNDRATALAVRCGGEVRPWDRWTDSLPHADVVVFSARSPEPLVSASQLHEAAERRGAPALWIDLASPGNVVCDASDTRIVRRALADLAGDAHPEIDAHVESSLHMELARFRANDARRQSWCAAAVPPRTMQLHAD